MKYTKFYVKEITSSIRRILYHGTTSLNKDSIEKNGLSIKHQSRPSISVRVNNGSSLGGIYLGSYNRALYYAKSQAKYWGGSPMIVSIVFKPDSYTAFDDDLVILILNQYIKKEVIRKKQSIINSLCDTFKFLYYLPDTIVRSIINEKTIKYIELFLYNPHISDTILDKISREFGKLIPYIKKSRGLNYDPYGRIRYLTNIKFDGKVRISDIKIL